MFSYTLFIMLLPLLSFIVLGLAGMKMQHKVAGLIGTCSLGLVTILSYLTAFQYFGMDRVDGVYQTFVRMVRRDSSVTTLSFHSSLCQCWDWFWPPTSSRCTCSGSW